MFWVDQASTDLGHVTADDLAAYQGSFCGPAGGYERVRGLLGDVWGGAAASSSSLIQDAPGALQDVNIVFLAVPGDTGWGGYFYGLNNMLRSQAPASNEALAFFVNAPNARFDRDYYQSLLLHELTHMVNYYQRAVVRGVLHQTWLEETSAMMTEDLVAPSVIAGGYTTILGQRIDPYLMSGGNVALTSWSSLSTDHYAMGGAFGAFLDRRYGTGLYRALVGCSGQSWTCVDGLVRDLGGAGFEDELARFGATALGALPAQGCPDGFGYPQLTVDGLTLFPFNLSRRGGLRPSPATPLGGTFLPTSHTYQLDTIAIGQTRYGRSGVVVPPHSTLVVVVR